MLDKVVKSMMEFKEWICERLDAWVEGRGRSRRRFGVAFLTACFSYFLWVSAYEVRLHAWAGDIDIPYKQPCCSPFQPSAYLPSS